jgi:hypothetical protein
VDESGEDYLFPETYFVPIELPNAPFEHLPTRHSALTEDPS